MVDSTDPGIRIPAALRQRIKVHAAIADLSMSDYLDSIVPQLPAPARTREGENMNDEHTNI
jgi:hypothetical protein